MLFSCAEEQLVDEAELVPDSFQVSTGGSEDSNQKRQLVDSLKIIWNIASEDAPNEKAKQAILGVSWESSSLDELETSLNMTLQMIDGSDPGLIARYDSALLAKGLPTIEYLRNSIYHRVVKILNVGVIAS